MTEREKSEDKLILTELDTLIKQTLTKYGHKVHISESPETAPCGLVLLIFYTSSNPNDAGYSTLTIGQIGVEPLIELATKIQSQQHQAKTKRQTMPALEKLLHIWRFRRRS